MDIRNFFFGKKPANKDDKDKKEEKDDKKKKEDPPKKSPVGGSKKRKFKDDDAEVETASNKKSKISPKKQLVVESEEEEEVKPAPKRGSAEKSKSSASKSNAQDAKTTKQSSAEKKKSPSSKSPKASDAGPSTPTSTDKKKPSPSNGSKRRQVQEDEESDSEKPKATHKHATRNSGSKKEKQEDSDVEMVEVLSKPTKRSPAADKKSPASDKKSPAADKKSPAADKKSPAADKKSPASDKKPSKVSPANKSPKRKLEEEDDDDLDFAPPPENAKPLPPSKPSKPSTSKSKKTSAKNKPQLEITAPPPKPKPKPEPKAFKEDGDKTDEEKEEQKPTPKKSFAFWNKQSRPPPLNKGSKEVPIGQENCLHGLVFLVSGILESLDRDEVHDLVKTYSGDVAKSVTRKLTHAIIGVEAGEKKMQQISDRKDIKIITEDDFLEMIRSRPAQRVTLTAAQKAKAKAAAAAIKLQNDAAMASIEAANAQAQTTTVTVPSPRKKTPEKEKGKAPAKHQEDEIESTPPVKSPAKPRVPSSMWVDMYKPIALTDLVGNSTLVDSLSKWLANWENTNLKPAGSGPAKQEAKRAVLLSGPPGIGKTSAAFAVCKARGYEAVEFNASDTRSKKMIQSTFAEITGSHSISKYFSNSTSTQSERICVIMDEVDGLSGNEDRGGSAELIALVHKTKVPIICICNDDYSPKVRSLANHCLHLKFKRPTFAQVSARLMAILQSNKMNVEYHAVEKAYLASNSDIRQTLHLLQMWRTSHNPENPIKAQQIQQKLKMASKDMEISCFAATESLLQGRSGSFADKLDMYFVDYGIMPLFIQENYLSNTPSSHVNYTGQRLDALELVTRAAEYISHGDLVDRVVRSNMRWDMLNAHAALSTVGPSCLVQGKMSQIKFPSWLGKNSSQNKNKRLLSEVQTHARGKVTSDSTQMRLEYFPHMRNSFAAPLIKDGVDGVDTVIEKLDEYGLSKEDFDSIVGVCDLGKEDFMKQIPAKVKSALTRKYNSTSHTVTAAKATIAPTRVRSGGDFEEEIEPSAEDSQEAVEGEGEQEDDLKTDKLIKSKADKKSKPKAKAAAKGKSKKRSKPDDDDDEDEDEKPAKKANTKGKAKKK